MPAREFVVRCAQAVALAGRVQEAEEVDVDGAVRSVAALGRIFHCARAALVTVVTVAGAVPLQRGLQSEQFNCRMPELFLIRSRDSALGQKSVGFS